MIKGFADINNNLIDEICNKFDSNYDFNSLIENYQFLDYYVIFSILYSTKKYKDELFDYLCQEIINDKKILLISDTHYGSKYQDLSYTYKMFEFVINNNIHTILHGGDIIESNLNGKNVIKQADTFINKFPSDKSVNTYALLGNHDYLAINKNIEVRNIISSRDDIKILGFKKTFLNWHDNVISLQHEIEKYKLCLPSCVDSIGFKGHSHFYHIRDEKDGKSERIYIPSMCNDPVAYMSSGLYLRDNNLTAKPGFLTAEITDENIIVSHYSFIKNDIRKENEFVKVLKNNS